MTNPRADLSETYREMSDEELQERWIDGHLTEIAMEVARAEFFRRGMQLPEISTREYDDAASASEETVTFVTVARSLKPLGTGHLARSFGRRWNFLLCSRRQHQSRELAMVGRRWRSKAARAAAKGGAGPGDYRLREVRTTGLARRR